MQPSHIEHIGIAVTSLDESIPFFEKLLGTKCYAIEEVADQKVKTAFLRCGQTKIELLEPTSPESTIAAFIEKNNGKGGIFNLLRGLEQSPARDQFVSAEHHTSAEGICQQNNVKYLKATNMEELQQGISTLLNTNSSRPVLLEVFTDPAEDERVYKDYYKTLKI
jgi:hypothetical protein